MKSLLFFAGLICSVSSFAQNCLGYYFLQADKTVEMAIYNKKGDESARHIYKISNVTNDGGSTVADVNSEMIDKKGKTISKTSSRMKCTDGAIMVDMKVSMPMQPGQTYESDVKADNLYIEYPTGMKVGDELKDASMHLDMDGANGMKQTIDMDVTERKVEGQEKVTTAAGSWDCFKISQKTKMKIKTMGIGVPMNFEGTEWFAPGFGVVKTQSKYGSTAIVSIK